MAEQIKIFDFSFGNTVENIAKLKAELKETKKAFEQATPNSQQFTQLGTTVKSLETQIKTLNAVTKDNQNALGGINTASKFAAGSYGELKQRIEAQKKALLELNTESEDFAKTQDELIKLQEQRIEIEKKIPSLFQERIKGAIDESNSLKQLRIDLKAAQSAALNGDGAAAKKVAELKDKIDDLKDSTQSLQGSGVERLNASMGLLTEGFKNFDTDKIKTGFKGIGSAMSAIPIILIIEGIKALIDNFDEVVKFARELTGYINENAKAVDDLTTQIKLQEAANIKLTSSIENEIALMTAQGKSIDDILKKKKDLTDIQVAENDKNIQLGKAKKKQIEEETSLYETSKNVFLSVLGLQSAAVIEQIKVEKDRAIKIAEVNTDIAKSESETDKLKTALTIAEIEANKKKIEEAKKLAEAAKARAEKEREIEQKKYEESVAAYNRYIQTMEDMRKSSESIDDNISREAKDKQLKRLDDIKQAKAQAFQDDIARANTAYNNAITNYENTYSQELELLHAKEAQELASVEDNEILKAEIRSKYRLSEQQLELQHTAQQLDAASNLSNSLGGLSDALFQLKRSNLEKGSEEDRAAAEQQFNVNKAFGITTALISGAVAVINASASVPYLPVGLAASIAAAATTAATIAKISSTQFQYFDGGYTGEGNPHDVSTNLGKRDYTYHKDEYITPSKVLNTPEGMYHVSKLEAMRKGVSKSNIAGFYDGGYTNRQAGANVENSMNSVSDIINIMQSQPAPIVRVTDINNMSKSNNVAVNVSGL